MDVKIIDRTHCELNGYVYHIGQLSPQDIKQFQEKGLLLEGSRFFKLQGPPISFVVADFSNPKNVVVIEIVRSTDESVIANYITNTYQDKNCMSCKSDLAIKYLNLSQDEVDKIPVRIV